MSQERMKTMQKEKVSDWPADIPEVRLQGLLDTLVHWVLTTSVCLCGAGGPRPCCPHQCHHLVLMQPHPPGCSGAVTETLTRYSPRCWQDLGGEENVLLLFGVFQYFIEFYTVRERLSQRGQGDSGWLSLTTSLKSRHYLKSRAPPVLAKMERWTA